MTSFVCSKCHSQFAVDRTVANGLEGCPICGGDFVDVSLQIAGQSHRFHLTTPAPADPSAVIDHLKVEAEHKAALKMFYAGADVLREYHGAFAQETAAAREKLAQDYEERGHVAERERLAHEPLLASAGASTRHFESATAHALAHWPILPVNRTQHPQHEPVIHKQARKCHTCHRPVPDKQGPCPYCKQHNARQQRLLALAALGVMVVALLAVVHSLRHPWISPAQNQAFDQAIVTGDLDQAARLMSANASLVNAANSAGQTPLGIAVEAGNGALIDLLLAHGADINATGYHCLTPLMLAVENANYKMVARLLQHGADVHRVDCQNRLMALHLVGAADNKADVSIAQILVSYGADVNEKGDALLGATPLACCSNSKTAVADFLRSKGGHL